MAAARPPAARRRRASLGSRRPAPAAALLLQQTPSPFLHCNGYGDGDDQLTTCTKLALDHIDIDLENVQGFDSNAFTMKLFDDNDDLIYFHVVFTGETPGRRGGGGKRYSFAEIVGKDKPEEVRMWKEMDEESENCTVENCIFCTGMWHPLSGGFCGYKRKKKNRR
ncbi:uncharacterized protein [Oryza sativa Japonica Group]|uniref:Uncharacterized protein n=3 Tax=Oryza TaxID=4527 RepID=A0A0E0PZG4_ORYRU|nr:uncharacterized protein LOC4341367 isoform X1 [Oryza sativa Japonica Group]